ncbi:hypothetical protein NK553_14730 [Pseudomonas sp. ZM23]|uniref:Uncharacterized protein n=1 Tax=Pseudomonas triclosanedens TaxID=2961893 RepID=A0ABY6ZVV5_9PSED|nr:hypothetical protein [Pseudomonas triclosanedens]MCP8465205.1 hypothetical protein [Pseudomonas triclosanedens]MCP8470855.1 hypothetical protein [Pseudomonas triclosanedens]MCP8476576.1 hypothetical protein [Pseudomonas triclosanedens]WAI49039.1 hypothetical protein OU419_25370 [Pseudomonas triclosanedens]
MSISPETLQVIADATVRLAELRQKECKHLCIENTAPTIFGGLLSAYVKSTSKETLTSAMNLVSVTGELDVKALLGS